MGTTNSSIITPHTADAAINPYRIVKAGAADLSVAQAAAATDYLMGVTGRVSADAAGEQVDVYRDGVQPVDFGGTITRGQPLTSDANGKAVVAAPSAGTNNRIIGFAEISGVSGDRGLVFINPGLMQG